MDTIQFEKIKTDIIKYMSSQDEFRDYNWTGPAITTLIDALAYVSYYLMVYSNFSINEVFLKTARLRSSIISKAEMMGYEPYQYTSSRVDMRIVYKENNSHMKNQYIPKGSTFYAKGTDSTYIFRTIEEFPVYEDNNYYYADITAYEGNYITETFTIGKNVYEGIELSNSKIDISSLNVVVKESANVIKSAYMYSDIISDINHYIDDKIQKYVYRVTENSKGMIELYFSDINIFKSLEEGYQIEVTYRICSGSETNNIANFSIANIPLEIKSTLADENISTSRKWSILTNTYSYGGGEKESDESIRNNSPFYLQRQGRNVNVNDYRSDVINSYGSIIQTLNVWGGEQNEPPVYGKVFLCIKPKSGEKLNEKQKEDIIEHIRKNSVVTIIPEIVDPEVMYISISNKLYINDYYSDEKKESIISDVKKITETYFNDTFSSFDNTFIYPRYISSIYNIDDNIVDNDTIITLSKKLNVSKNNTNTHVISFENTIKTGEVIIGPFTNSNDSDYSYKITDSRVHGYLDMYRIDNNTNSDIILNKNIGTVDYETGTITVVHEFDLSSTFGNKISVYVKSQNNNISVTKNVVFDLYTNGVMNINTVVEKL